MENMTGFMSREEKLSEAKRQFDSLDYNNQRNLLLFARSNAIHIATDGAPDTCPHCPYHEDYSFVCDIVTERKSEDVTKMIDMLTRKGHEMRLQELLEALV